MIFVKLKFQPNQLVVDLKKNKKALPNIQDQEKEFHVRRVAWVNA
jgi:hypothetical protein